MYTFEHGNGSPENPYQIWDIDDFNGIYDYADEASEIPNFFNNHFIQMANIDISFGFIGDIPLLQCNYNGNNKKLLNPNTTIFSDIQSSKVYDLTIEGEGDYYLFGHIQKLFSDEQNEPSEVYNIIFKDIQGVPIEQAQMGTTIRNIRAENTYGLIHAVYDSYVKDCYNVDSTIDLGGIVNEQYDSIIEDCQTYRIQDLTGQYDAGGIVGYAYDSEIKNCVTRQMNSFGSWGSLYNAGGIVGQAYNTKVSDCAVLEHIQWRSNYQIAFIVGTAYDNCEFERCVQRGQIQSSYWNCGFFAGEVYDSTFKQCAVEGIATYVEYFGGFVGSQDNCTFEDCYVDGTIEYSDYFGGFCATQLDCDFINCYSNIKYFNSWDLGYRGSEEYDEFCYEVFGTCNFTNNYSNKEKFNYVELYGWGANQYNQLGFDGDNEYLSPIRLNILSDWNYTLKFLEIQSPQPLSHCNFVVFEGFLWFYLNFISILGDIQPPM